MIARVIDPIRIDDSKLQSCTVPEPSLGESLWVASGNYNVDDVVLRPNTHRLYKCLVAGVSATAPELDPLKWFDWAPSNRFAMFDVYANTVTRGASPLVMAIRPGEIVSGLALVGLDAGKVTVTQTVNGQPVRTWVKNLYSRQVSNIFEFCFKPFSRKTMVAIWDVLPYTDPVFTVTIEHASGSVGVGAVLMAFAHAIGKTQYGADVGVTSLSQFNREKDGTVTFEPGRSVPQDGLEIECKAERLNFLFGLLNGLMKRPAFWAGIDDDTHPYFEPLAKYGALMSYKSTIHHPRLSTFSLQIEEY